MKEAIKDQHGKIIGYKMVENGNGNSTYIRMDGSVVGRVRNDTTLDSHAAVRGSRDQVLRLFSK
jgi:hypothetical protein